MPNRIENKQVWNQQPQLQVKDQMLCTAAPWRGPSATAIRFLPGVLWKNGLTIGENQPETLLFTIWNFPGAFFPGCFSLGNASTMSQPQASSWGTLGFNAQGGSFQVLLASQSTGHDSMTDALKWKEFVEGRWFFSTEKEGWDDDLSKFRDFCFLFDVNYGRRWA